MEAVSTFQSVLILGASWKKLLLIACPSSLLMHVCVRQDGEIFRLASTGGTNGPREML